MEKICPKCGRPMYIKHSKFGYFYSCSGFKDGSCKYTESCDENGNPVKKEYHRNTENTDNHNNTGNYQNKNTNTNITENSQNNGNTKKFAPIIAKDNKCPECGSDLVDRVSKSGKNYKWCKRCKTMYFQNKLGNWQKWTPKENNSENYQHTSQYSQSQNNTENTRPAYGFDPDGDLPY